MIKVAQEPSIDKLRKVAALFDRATSEGEKRAAAEALSRLLKNLPEESPVKSPPPPQSQYYPPPPSPKKQKQNYRPPKPGLWRQSKKGNLYLRDEWGIATVFPSDGGWKWVIRDFGTDQSTFSRDVFYSESEAQSAAEDEMYG